MRVTTQMFYNQFLTGIQQTLSAELNDDNQIATGKSINEPSDNPTALAEIVDYQTQLSGIAEYTKTQNAATVQLQSLDTALSSLNNTVGQANELAIEANSGSTTADQRLMISDQVTNLFDTAVNIANTKSGGQYIFGGYQSNVPPINPATGELTGDSNSVNVNISNGINISTNISASGLFSFKRVNTTDSAAAILPAYNWTNDGANTIPDADPVSALETSAPATTTYAINPQDSISIDGTSVTLNPGTSPVNYDAAGFAQQLQSAIQAKGAAIGGAAGAALEAITVSYDSAGNKFQISNTGGTSVPVNWGSTTPDIEQELGFVSSGDQTIGAGGDVESDYTVNAFSSSNSIFTANGGTINIKSSSGQTTSVGVNIPANATLQDVRDAINSANAGVKAQVVNTGTSANPDFRLVIASDPVGNSAGIDISVSSTEDPAGTGLNMLSYDNTTGDNMTLGTNITNYNYIDSQTTGNNSMVIDDGTNGCVANNQIVFTLDGQQETATIARGTYTPEQLTTAISDALNTAAAAAGKTDTYTATYDPTEQKFTIAGNSSNPDLTTLDWSDTGSTARQLLGYNAADEGVALDIGPGSNTIVFNDGTANRTATVASGVYSSGSALAAAIQTAMNDAPGSKITDFSVGYNTSTNTLSISTSGAETATITNTGDIPLAQLGLTNNDSIDSSGLSSAAGVPIDGQSDSSVVANYYSFNNNYLNDNNILRALNFLNVSLENNDTGRIEQAIQYTTDLSNVVSEKQADVGSRENEITNISSYQASVNTNVNTAMSNLQDTDIAKVSTDLSQQQTTLQALLTSAASVMQENLFEFMK